MPTMQKVFQVADKEKICSKCRGEQERISQTRTKKKNKNINRREVVTEAKVKTRPQLAEPPRSGKKGRKKNWSLKITNII